jgi:hypothetical protein
VDLRHKKDFLIKKKKGKKERTKEGHHHVKSKELATHYRVWGTLASKNI